MDFWYLFSYKSKGKRTENVKYYNEEENAFFYIINDSCRGGHQATDACGEIAFNILRQAVNKWSTFFCQFY